MPPAERRSLDRGVERPEHAEGIAQLAVTVAPELVRERHDHRAPGVNRALPPSLDVASRQREHQRVTLMRYFENIYHIQNLNLSSPTQKKHWVDHG